MYVYYQRKTNEVPTGTRLDPADYQAAAVLPAWFVDDAWNTLHTQGVNWFSIPQYLVKLPTYRRRPVRPGDVFVSIGEHGVELRESRLLTKITKRGTPCFRTVDFTESREW